MYLSSGVSYSSFASLFCERKLVEDLFKTLVVLSAISLPIKSLVASAVFWIALFEAVFIASVDEFFSHQEVVDHIHCLNFYPCFL